MIVIDGLGFNEITQSLGEYDPETTQIYAGKSEVPLIASATSEVPLTQAGKSAVPLVIKEYSTVEEV